MKIERQNYSRNPWRLIANDGRQVVSDKRDSSGRIVATGHPVCGNTKQEVMDWVLDRLEWYASHAKHGLLPPYGPGVEWTDNSSPITNSAAIGSKLT